MSQNSKFVFPIRSSLVKEPEAHRPRRVRFRQRRSGNLPRSLKLVNNFFSNPETFFRAAGLFVPAQKRESNRPRCRCQLLFFKKPAAPRSAFRRRPASETFRPAAARTGYAPLGLTCQRLFIFFCIFSGESVNFSFLSVNYPLPSLLKSVMALIKANPHSARRGSTYRSI